MAAIRLFRRRPEPTAEPKVLVNFPALRDYAGQMLPGGRHFLMYLDQSPQAADGAGFVLRTSMVREHFVEVRA